MPFTSSKRKCARHCDEYKCSYCPKLTFPNSFALIKHLKKSYKHRDQEDAPFYCLICNRYFLNKIGYIDHLQKKRIHKYDLHQAACCGRFQDVGKLICSEYADIRGASHKLKSGAQLNYQLGATPMHCAAFKGYSKCLKIMLSWRDGNPNVRDESDGQTPVHVAAKCGRASSLKLLLSQGGRLDLRDKDGKTPINLMARGPCEDVILEHQIEIMVHKYFNKRFSASLVKYSTNLVEGYSGNITHSNIQQISMGQTSISKYHSITCEQVAVPTSNEQINDREESVETSPEGDEASITEDDNKSVRRHLSYEASDEPKIYGGNSEDEPCFSRDDSGSASLTRYSNNSVEKSDDNTQQISLRQISSSKDQTEIREVPSELLPYEILARGEKAVDAYKIAMSEGTAFASRLKLIVVGEVGAGKTSLTRALSGKPFTETREKTRGIQTSMVSEPMVTNTELNVSWKPADPNNSHFDEVVSWVVSEVLGRSLEYSKPQLGGLPSSSEEFQENQIGQSQLVEECPGLISPCKSPSAAESETRVIVAAEPCIPVEGENRELPATRIAKKLLQKRSEPMSVKVNIWDFAGHQLYETMHHVFMNSRGLYLVVFSLLKMTKSVDKSLARIHFWLNSIASHTSSSTPIIVVGTHKAKVDSDFIEEANKLCEKHFGNTFGPRLVRNFEGKIVFAVENSRGQEDEGISCLIEDIKREASSNLPFVTQELPLKWLHCEEEIVTYQNDPNTKKCLTLDEVRNLLQDKCKVTFTDEEFRSMLAFFHDNGLILLPDNMYDNETEPCVKDLVVLSPQFLVDVMTRIHDAPQDRTVKRQFSDEFKKLGDQGRADCCLLDHVWKDLEKTEVLVRLLSHFNLLHPVHNEVEDESKENINPVQASSPSEADSGPIEFIIPCMLKEKSRESTEKRWKKLCDQWQDRCPNEHVFVFDFGRFLPPALFDYVLVHVYRRSIKTKGIKPFLNRRTGIFSFSNRFLFRLELVLKSSQIWVYARMKDGEQLLTLARELRESVNQIRQQHFKFLKFVCGPPCPRPDCPGAIFDVDVVQRPCESSSSESEGSDDAECSEQEKLSMAQAPTTSSGTSRRSHVIQMKPNLFDPPYWCEGVQIQNDDLKDWDPTNVTVEDLCRSFEECEVSDCPPEKCVVDCCLRFVAELLGNDWKDIGRELEVPEAKIENLGEDHKSQQKEQGFQVLYFWKKRLASGATIAILTTALEAIGRKDVVENLRQHCQKDHED